MNPPIPPEAAGCGPWSLNEMDGLTYSVARRGVKPMAAAKGNAHCVRNRGMDRWL